MILVMLRLLAKFRISLLISRSDKVAVLSCKLRRFHAGHDPLCMKTGNESLDSAHQSLGENIKLTANQPFSGASTTADCTTPRRQSQPDSYIPSPAPAYAGNSCRTN